MLKILPILKPEHFNEDYCMKLLRSIKRYFHSILKNETRSAQHLHEVRERILFLQEYNKKHCCATYPHRHLEIVLVKYVQIEMKFSRNHDEAARRICTVLRQVLQTVYKTENIIKLQQQIFEEVKVLSRNKFTTQFIGKLLQQTCSKLYKDDSEKDVTEVPLSSAIPTIEFIDDENYFYYLEKRKTDEIIELSDTEEAPPSRRNVATLEILDDDDLNYVIYVQKEVKSRRKPKIKEEIVVLSDSEDELNFSDLGIDNFNNSFLEELFDYDFLNMISGDNCDFDKLLDR